LFCRVCEVMPNYYARSRWRDLTGEMLEGASHAKHGVSDQGD
jgi:hypothetical protein